MVDVVLELAFVDDVINLLTNTLDSTVKTNLTDDELIVLALAKLEALIDRLIGISNDVLQSERSKLTPLLLNRSQCNTGGFFLLQWLLVKLRVLHVRWHV